ncbi:MAG: HAD hydrolase-like protein, partial [Chthoniobacterales bacterium]|nr:HAD hydrolase-like protein [Chthoniobacterales bacterium]
IKKAHFEKQASSLGVRDLFTATYTEVMDKREKIRWLLAEHGLKARETVFIGDMVHDVETARHGGVLSIAVLTGFDPVEKLIPAKPDILVQNLRMIFPFFDIDG